MKQEGNNPAVTSDKKTVATATAISVRSLWKVFGDSPEQTLSEEYAQKSKTEILQESGAVVALRDVSFDVQTGESFVVMGLSGSGKSTLVRCLIRLVEPTAGEVYVGDEDILQYAEQELIDFRRSKIGMVFQHFGLLPHRRVLDNVAWGLEIQGVQKEERIARAQDILEVVGLKGWETAYPRELSGGMQQRVGLARAVVSDPEILLMDEPFSGLDPLIRRDMQNELLRLQAQMQKTTVFITHDLSEAVKLGSRIAIMRDGELIQLGTPEEIVSDPVDDYVADFIRDIRPSAVLTVGYVVRHNGTGQGDLSAVQDRPEATISSALTVEEALAENWSTAENMSVVDTAGGLVGVIDRERLLEAVFSQPASAISKDASSDTEKHGSRRKKESVAATSDSVKAPHKAESPLGVANLIARLVGNPISQMGIIPRVSLAVALLGALSGLVVIIWGLDAGFPANFGKGISAWINQALRDLTRNGAPVFDAISTVVQHFLLYIEWLFLWLPWITVILMVGALSWITVNRKLGLFAVGAFFAIGLVGLWDSAMETVALIVVAVIFSIALAIPLGIIAARSNIVDAVLRPLLDGMQTMPAFVYLVPGIMLFGIGNVPAIFATVIYAVPPAIRLTNLGIRQVTPQILEAAESFGTTRRQLLFKVQIPMAIPTIMAGVNQTIMMALAMVVVASLVGAGGLGEDVLRALSRFKPGEALLGGLAIVVLAIIVDRVTQAWARGRQDALSTERK
jgi:glycine betaine/proline transport system ATP-binding protein